MSKKAKEAEVRKDVGAMRRASSEEELAERLGLKESPSLPSRIAALEKQFDALRKPVGPNLATREMMELRPEDIGKCVDEYRDMQEGIRWKSDFSSTLSEAMMLLSRSTKSMKVRKKGRFYNFRPGNYHTVSVGCGEMIEALVFILRKEDPRLPAAEIARQLNVSREYIRLILVKLGLPTSAKDAILTELSVGDKEENIERAKVLHSTV